MLKSFLRSSIVQHEKFRWVVGTAKIYPRVNSIHSLIYFH